MIHNLQRKGFFGGGGVDWLDTDFFDFFDFLIRTSEK